MYKQSITIITLLLTLFFQACSNDSGEVEVKNNVTKSTLVSTTPVNSQRIEVTQATVGTLEGLISPTLAAETAARVIKVNVYTGQTVKKGQLIATLDASDFIMQRNEANAEVARINAQLENQTKIVARNQVLVDKNFISQNALDNEIAQEKVLKEQLVAAKAQVASINHNSSKSKVIAPVDGIVESITVDTGDYLRIGDPIAQIISKQSLRAHLPFPEQFGPQLKPGLTVRLKTPTSSEIIETVIHELKPKITEGNRTIDVIADVKNAAGWQPGATVTATVVLGQLPAAIMVPEQSLVLRPAGEVVYVVRDNIAYQAIVKTGLRQNGFIEILSGLEVNEIVVVDGAGFLTDKTPVKIDNNDAA